jgi:hypothetical protein
MRKRLLGTTLVLLLSLTSGCGAASPPQLAPEPRTYGAPATEPQITQTEPVPIAKLMEGQSGIITMVVTDQGFEPDTVITQIGGTVRIHLKNESSLEQNLSIPRFGIYTKNLNPGGETYAAFTVSEKGEWPFFSDPREEWRSDLVGRLKVE